MTQKTANNFPKLHNAMWPGLVGKGSPGAEPCLDLDTMLDLTTKAEVNGVKFDGVDIFLFDPHVSIDISDDGLKKIARGAVDYIVKAQAGNGSWGYTAGVDGDTSLLKPGVAVFVIALKHDDGTVTSGRLYVEKDGIKPPM